MTHSDLVRVLFHLEAGQESATERLWAESIGGGRYRLRNSPFFAFGVSAGDVVFAKDIEGETTFAGVSIYGGHSTYRLKVVPGGDAEFRLYWTALQQAGCSYEQGQVLAVDVPTGADIYEIYAQLEAGEAAGVWEFEEGHCGHPLRDDAVAIEDAT